MRVVENASKSLLILADDLTGAADCAARCRQAGMPATIYLRPPDPPLPLGAIAFTSDSRHLSPELAAKRVRAAMDGLVHLTDVVWYKKLDSTLRGNLGSELDAVLDTLGQPCAIICPAFPAQGRGLHQGQLVGGAASPHPADLPTMLAQQSQRPVAAIALTNVRTGVEHLADRLATAQGQGAQLIVVDALSDADLYTILAAAEQVLPSALLCGSAGLVGALAIRLSRSTAYPSDDVVTEEPLGTGPALLVIGSGSSIAHRQIEYVRQQGLVRTVKVGVDSAYNWEADILLHLPEPSPDTGLDGSDARMFIARLADAAVSAIEQLQPTLLILVGGDTAINILERLGVQRLMVVRELLPGMPLTWGLDAADRGIYIILKAGNYGDTTALATLLQLARSKA